MRPRVHTKQSPQAANKKRLCWALVRIFIGLTSAAFFMYFLVSEVRSFIQVKSVENGVEIGTNIIEWLRISGIEEETSKYWLFNVTILPPDVIDDADTRDFGFAASIKIELSHTNLQILQDESIDALKEVISDAIENSFFVGDELDRIHELTSEYEQYQSLVVSNKGNFTWSFYFKMTDMLHTLRLTLLDVVSRNVNYQQQDIAHCSVSLSSIFYYLEYLGLCRDGIFHLVLSTGRDVYSWHDRVVEYFTATNIYYLETTQKLPSELSVRFLEAATDKDWLICNNSLEELVFDQNNFTQFNTSNFFDCTAYLMHSLRPIRLEIKSTLNEVLAEYVGQLETSLSMACIGFALELMAAITLIQQALPVVLLYINFSKVLDSAVNAQSRSDRKTTEQ